MLKDIKLYKRTELYNENSKVEYFTESTIKEMIRSKLYSTFGIEVYDDSEDNPTTNFIYDKFIHHNERYEFNLVNRDYLEPSYSSCGKRWIDRDLIYEFIIAYGEMEKIDELLEECELDDWLISKYKMLVNKDYSTISFDDYDIKHHPEVIKLFIAMVTNDEGVELTM